MIFRDNNKTLIVILGPTASGKTELAMAVAQHFKTEIISADSRQFYKELPIGTAAPDIAQCQKVKHHFVGHLPVTSSYSVFRFEQDVLELLTGAFQSKHTMVMVGGSGLYINAVCHGIDNLPDPDAALRHKLDKLWNEKGIAALQHKLKVLDPDFFQTVDQNNAKRLLRAIEVCLQTGKPYSQLRLNKRKERPFNILKIGLEVPREVLNHRIAQRTEEMLRKGWLDEARAVLPFRNYNALNTVGYKELFGYFDGILTLEEAVEKIKTNTRRYAKRQMTWFRKDKNIHWFDHKDPAQIIQFIAAALKRD
ncbi:MAG: tRNA (adenosine(37)-N6)-dimethylallyltransferase MiaA [Bacteroidales bacterium]|nr:tRNA (adenosine(37)-N6)-dimethylallyltransferase MiaA [Bacteroidales bacterium]